MPIAKSRSKNIACLETFWDERMEDRLSMKPILDVVKAYWELRVVYLTCNTDSELRFNLDLLAKRKSFKVLYLAFHGCKGEIELNDGTKITLDLLAQAMGQKFKDRIVYFGSCSTMNINEEKLRAFVEKTGVTSVMGYTTDVDWVDSAALDLIVLSHLQNYIDLSALRRRLTKDYTSLTERLGFVAYP